MSSQFPVPQALALFECGELKEPIDFSYSENESQTFEGKGEDEINEYTISDTNIPFSGTIIVKNKETGEFQAIPVNHCFSISKQSKIQNFTKLEISGTEQLVHRFGTRQAQRLYNQRAESNRT